MFERIIEKQGSLLLLSTRTLPSRDEIPHLLPIPSYFPVTTRWVAWSLTIQTFLTTAVLSNVAKINGRILDTFSLLRNVERIRKELSINISACVRIVGQERTCLSTKIRFLSNARLTRISFHREKESRRLEIGVIKSAGAERACN